MPAKVFVKTQKLVDAETRQKKRHCESGRVKRRKHETAAPAAARGGESDDAAEYWTNAWSPTRCEGHSQRSRPENAAWFIVGEEACVFVECRNLEQADQLQTKRDDYETADNSHPRIARNRSANQTGSRTKDKKNN